MKDEIYWEVWYLPKKSSLWEKCCEYGRVMVNSHDLGYKQAKETADWITKNWKVPVRIIEKTIHRQIKYEDLARV